MARPDMVETIKRLVRDVEHDEKRFGGTGAANACPVFFLYGLIHTNCRRRILLSPGIISSGRFRRGGDQRAGCPGGAGDDGAGKPSRRHEVLSFNAIEARAFGSR
jgi:hypothetical protein